MFQGLALVPCKHREEDSISFVSTIASEGATNTIIKFEHKNGVCDIAQGFLPCTRRIKSAPVKGRSRWFESIYRDKSRKSETER